MNITKLEQAYKNKLTTPSEVVAQIYSDIRLRNKGPIWIELVSEDENLTRAKHLEKTGNCDALPLYGVPFAVKDNFDVAGLTTTAACPAFAHIAEVTAEAVERLINAGAILIGKTNMDQFATGLVGTRTPYGICSSVFNPEYISGGSSSGSAIAVAQGIVSFSLGTDTAGSGRVPAAFNQLVGLKPTRGLVSTHGVLPACRTLDCVSIFAETCLDASTVLNVIKGSDNKDPYSRTAKPGEGAAPWITSKIRVGIPTEESMEFFGDTSSKASYELAIEQIVSTGYEIIRFDYRPFHAVASLLYNGPWVAERLAAIYTFASLHHEEMDPTVSKIVTGASRFSAVQCFQASYELQQIKRLTDAVLDQVDILMLPTAPTIYKVAEVQADPVQLNSNLGYYTNFVNLLDLAAVAIPAGLRADGLPFGVSIIGRAFTDDALLQISDQLHRSLAVSLGGSNRLLTDSPSIHRDVQPPGCILMAVVGAHLTGEPLNWQLTTRRAQLVRTTRTHRGYRLYVLPNSTPAKPGLVYEPGFAGPGIELEIWAMPADTVGTFLNGIPAPLSLGTIVLEDGSSVKGFLCEPAGIVGAQEITNLGGWRTYMQEQRRLQEAPPQE